MKAGINFIRVFCALAAATSVGSEAAVFNYNVTADLSNPGIYTTDPQYDTTTVTLPLGGSPGPAYGSGDTLNVSIGFQGSQRLFLTAIPNGLSAPLGEQGIGLFVSDSALNFEVNGGLTSSVALIDPEGAYNVDSASAPISFGGAQGAITRLVTQWTSSTFSVAGFNFQMNIQSMTEPVVPNELVLEFREFNLQPTPEPATWCLLLAAIGVFRVARRVLRVKWLGSPGLH